jgi:hypothetical protein
MEAKDNKGWLFLFLGFFAILFPIEDEDDNYDIKWYYKIGFIALLIFVEIILSMLNISTSRY